MPQVQRAVIQRLRECAALSAVAPGGVHDAVPTSGTLTLPLIVYESAVETPNDTFGQRGHLTDVSIQIHTDNGSTKRSGRGTAGYITGVEIAEIVMNELLDNDTPLVVEGHDVVELSLIGINVLREGNATDSRVTEVSFTAESEDELV